MSILPESFFDLDGFSHPTLFTETTYAWEALSRINEVVKTYIAGRGNRPLIEGKVSGGASVENHVYVGPGAIIERGAYVQGPTIIGAGAHVRHGAYIRGNCIIGRNCIIGHATELKMAIMLDESCAAHFNYVGDSIVGRRVNLAAGVILSNFKSDGSSIFVTEGERRIDTRLRKFGAIVGDDVKIGCNSVLSPGTMIGPGSQVYPGAVLRGMYGPNSIIKLRQQHEIVERVDGLHQTECGE